MEVVIRKDKISGALLAILLDSSANYGFIPYVEIGGVHDEMSLEYYQKWTKKPTNRDIEKAIKHLQKRYGEEITLKHRLPNDFRERFWRKGA